jgi:hypothetical protein
MLLPVNVANLMLSSFTSGRIFKVNVPDPMAMHARSQHVVFRLTVNNNLGVNDLKLERTFGTKIQKPAFNASPCIPATEQRLT